MPSMTGKPTERGFSLERDLAALEDAVQRATDARLVDVDPVSADLGATSGPLAMAGATA